MALLTHIIIALASIGFASYLLVMPSRAKFRISYSLVACTIASGSYLVILSPSHMAHACLAGLVYISLILAALITAQYKLTRQET